MSENSTFLDIPKIMTSARENCILGLYQKALIKYKLAIQIVEKRIKEISDTLLKEKWHDLLKDLKSEESLIIGIVKSCDSFRNIYTEFGEQKNIYTDYNISDKKVIDSSEEKAEEELDILEQFKLHEFVPRIKEESNIEEIKTKELLDNYKSEGITINQVDYELGNNKKYYKFNEIENTQQNQPLIKCRGCDIKINKSPKKKEKLEKNYQKKEEKDIKIFQRQGQSSIFLGKGIKQKKNNSTNDIQIKVSFNKRKSEKNKCASIRGSSGYIKPVTNGNFQKKKNINLDKKIDKSNKSIIKNSKLNNLKENKEKSKFLLERYPNGNGPDSELIEMLEREVVDINPNVSFDDIAELGEAKKALQEAVLLPLIIPDYFKGIRRPWRGILLFGPPGTGKTMLAKALATQGKTTFFNVHSSSFASKWRGESEKLVRILFEMARFYAPTTIFIDEVDSLCSKRGENDEGEASRRVKAELLVQMEGVNSNTSASANEKSEEEKRKIVTVMAATNRPWDLDDALRRRFEKRIYIPLPNEKGRLQLFNLNLRNISIYDDINFEKLVKKTEGYSGADISNVCREASFMPMRRELFSHKEKNIEDLAENGEFKKKLQTPISMNDLEEAICNISKSVSIKDLDSFNKWSKEFSSI